MFASRDYILRQIHVLAQALATAIGRRDRLTLAELERVMSDAIENVTGIDLSRLRQLPREELLELLAQDGGVNSELAVALADLLAVDEHPDSRTRAAWLYESALQAGGVVPHDIADRLARLRSAGHTE